MERIIAMFITLLVLTAPSAFASHEYQPSACISSECPLWARGATYNTPISTHSTSTSHDKHWYDDRKHETTQYVYHYIQHPPKHYFVHYNQNYYDHFTRNSRYSYRNKYSRQGQIVLIGDGFERYY